MESSESRVQWLFSSDGQGSFFSAGLLHAYELDRTALLLGSAQSDPPPQSPCPDANAETRGSKREKRNAPKHKPMPKPKAKASSKSSFSSTATPASSSAAEPGSTVRIATALHVNKYVHDKLSFLSCARGGVLVAGVFCAAQEAAVLAQLSRLLLPEPAASPGNPAGINVLSADALRSSFEASVGGVFAFFLAGGGRCRAVQRLVRGTTCQCADLAAAGSYRLMDLFVPPPLEAEAELAALCGAFWEGSSSIAPATQTLAGVTGSHATSTVFLRRELFFALDRYIGSSTDESRRIIFAIANKACSAVEVHSVFPKFPPEAVDALRAASDEASITAVGRKKIGKPKGYLAAFNLFVQAVRASLVRERDMKKLTNNTKMKSATKSHTAWRSC